MAQYISVKRKQQTNKHAPLAIMLCLLFLFSSFSFSYANGIGDLESLGITYTLNNNSSVSGNTFNIASGSGYPVKINFSENGVYDISFDFACPTNENYKLKAWNGGNTVDLFTYSDTGTIAANGRSVDIPQGSCSLTLHVESFESTPVSALQFYVVKSDGSSASSYTGTISNFSIGVESSSWSGSATVSVEAGCVAYILVDGGTATLSTTFPELSKLSRPLWVSGSTYSYESDLPSSGKVFSSTSGTLIDWLIPASAKTDLLGRSYQGGRPLSNLPSGQYLVVYNPVYRGYDDKGVGIMSPTIYVSLSNYVAVRQFRLTASYNGGIIESTSDDGYSSWFDSIGVEELDVNGNPIYVEHLADGTTQTAISIPAGGGNIVITDNNTDHSIGGLLERLLSLLTAPIKYIERLYNSAVQFFDYLSSLWGWLPVEVTSIIGAALAVLVVIGVVKFLWK